MFHTLRSQRQLRVSDGFIAGYVALGPKLTFWTVTVWRDREAMAAYRRSGPHLKAMPKLLDWCDEAAVATLSENRETPPGPVEAARRLVQEGRLSKVRHPSAAHARGDLWPDGLLPRPSAPIFPR